METYKIILFAISALAFWGYYFRVKSKWGIAKSISDSYYYHQDKLLFYGFLLFTAFPLMVVGEHGLSFFAGAAAIGVGTAPHFKGSRLEHRVHIACSYALYILGFAALVAFRVYLPVLIMVIFLAVVFLMKIKNRTWWVETVGYALLWLGLLINSINTF